ncbi:hypothetical protein PPGU16_78780 (plasmid) [Paraburkholderia largidicola]|uniref:Uncharacterized protein n=1 Tax=Paraburkholderia largidicola TaxID=3014751 RepID=A0A7I8C2R7_9BURK|nr:hypothetical protein PPGU16_78780 [Paraburkholderia sp. PGU16]
MQAFFHPGAGGWHFSMRIRFRPMTTATQLTAQAITRPGQPLAWAWEAARSAVEWASAWVSGSECQVPGVRANWVR